MKIDRYVSATEPHLRLVAEALESEGREALAHSLSELGWERLARLGEERPDLVHDLAIAHPRCWAGMLKQIGKPQHRHGYLILACYRLRLGHAWLTCAADRGADTSIDVHPLTMTMRAAEAAQALLSASTAMWPFVDGLDPLGEDL